ncbi:MAG: AraC family transcriptional regulator [Pseudomonadota bacterium]
MTRTTQQHGDNPLPFSRFDSTRLAEDDRFEATRQCMAPLYSFEPPREPARRKSFDVTMQGWNLGGVLFGRTRLDSPGVRLVHRRPAPVEGKPFQLLFYRHGGFIGSNGDHPMQVGQAQVGILDLEQELELEHSPASEHITLIIPREQLLSRLDGYPISGTVLKREQLTTQLLGHHIDTMARLLPQATQADLPALRDGLLDLISASLTQKERPEARARNAVAAATRSAIEAYIERHLKTPGLDAGAVCRHFGCSRAYLYRLFQPYGGVRHFIQTRRLRRILLALTEPKLRHWRIIDIALQHGFTNQSHFSRLFKQHFDITPRQARELAEQADSAEREANLPDLRGRPAFYHWLCDS